MEAENRSERSEPQTNQENSSASEEAKPSSKLRDLPPEKDPMGAGNPAALPTTR